MNLQPKSNWLVISILVTLLLFIVTTVKGQNTKVSPKLDFDETEDNNNNSTSVPIIPGTNKQKNDSRSDTTESNNSNHDDSKSRPKIHGVRVTVDTGDNQKTKESKESVEISSDSGKHKKRVGIHTDITFEISGIGDDDNNGTNTSSQRSDDDKEDASVPIFKGRSSTQKPRKPHDHKYNWNPNFSAERRSYDTIPRSGPGYSNYYPQYPNNVPIYTGSRTDGREYNRRDSDGWVSYVPNHSYWTTERTYNEHYRPNTVSGWKPCYCVNPDRRRRESPQQTAQTNPPPTNRDIKLNIDSKLESPFSA